jgi:LEA14-like dessication related protein
MPENHPTNEGPMPEMNRRRCTQWLVLSATAMALSGCASLLDREPVRVNVVGVEPLRGEGLEARLALKLRIVNPNDAAITYDGLSVSLDVRGQHFASGVSNERGEVPRFGEALITVPVSVSALSLVRQALDVARGGSPRIDYVLKGRLAGTALGSVGFSSQGEIDLPAEWARR